MTGKAHRSNSVTERRDHYAELTDRVIEALEAGTAPWQRPWDPNKAGGPSMPRNAVTGARYRGINVVTLGMSPAAFITGDPRWATYKQAAERGWQVRKGERGTTAYFFKRLEVEDTSASADGGTTKRIPMLRSFSLFHASQIDGLEPYQPPTVEEAPWRAPDAVEVIMANSGAVIRIGGDRAFYSPVTDHIQMPPHHAFPDASSWGGTLLHEGAHWSGAPGRLDRDLTSKIGDHDRAREELRAEIGMAMICGEIGLAYDFPNTAAYVSGWVSRLRSDRKEIFRAAADAQRIADYMLAFHPDYAAATAPTSTPTEAESGQENETARLAEAA